MEAKGEILHWIETSNLKLELSQHELNRVALGVSAEESALDMDLVYSALGRTILKERDGLQGDSFYHSILRVLPNGFFTFVKPRTLLTGPTQVNLTL